MKTLIPVIIIIALFFAQFSCGNTGLIADNDRTDDDTTAPPKKIALTNVTLNPGKGIESELKKLLAEGDERQYAVVLLKERLTAKNIDQVKELNVQLLGNISHNFYYASLPTGALDQLTTLIEWAGLYRPQYAIKNTLLEGKHDKLYIDSISGRLNILIQFFENVDKNEIVANFKKLGIEVQRYGHKNSWKIQVKPDKIKQLMSLKGIKLIQQGPSPFTPLNNGGRRRTKTDHVQNPTWGNPRPSYEIGGSGIRIGICDSGIDGNHSDFGVINANGNIGNSRIYNDRNGCGGHGTHVASIAGGNGFNSSNNSFPSFDLRGHAPLSQLGDYPNFYGTAQNYYDAIVGDDTDLTNHSYVQTFNSTYDIAAANIDAIIRGDGKDDKGNQIPARPQIWAAGNNGVSAQYGNLEGFYAAFTSAKNSISVGSIDTDNGRISDFSSMGPTFDGRIKPDLMAPGCVNSIPIPSASIQAARCGSQQYTGNCGTSMSAPVVSGVIALMMDAYQQSFGSQASNLTPSTYKAILINSATDLIKPNSYQSDEDFDNPDIEAPLRFFEGPDYSTGYGLINSEKAVGVIKNTSRWRQGTYTNRTQSYTLDVLEGSEDVQITLAWDDEPGDASLGILESQLVNDLDITITDPDGNVYYPWIIDPLPITDSPENGTKDPISTADLKPAYKGIDRLNNVEMITVCSPNSGRWRINITGFNLPNGNSQKYSLASTHDLQGYINIGIYNICERFPILCIIDEIYPPIKVIDDIWKIGPKNPIISVDEICKYVLDCPGCGSFWNKCPGYEFEVRGLPSNAIITLVNSDGDIIATEKQNQQKHQIKTGPITGGQNLFMIITDKNNLPLKQFLDLKIKSSLSLK